MSFVIMRFIQRKELLKLIFIGILAGTILATFLLAIYILIGSEAYLLLFNVDYLPYLKHLHPASIIGVFFHYTFCIMSVVFLFYILKSIHLERQLFMYVVVYTIGSAILFFLTGLSENPPAMTDLSAWGYWTLGHGIYSLIVGWLIKYWL